jgi:hypothetical protein
MRLVCASIAVAVMIRSVITFVSPDAASKWKIR